MTGRLEGLRRRLRSAPWGLVGLLALVTAGERALARLEADVLAPWHWDWRHTGRAASARAVTSAGVLCFGDSLVKFGVMPTVLRDATGRPAYNLALTIGQPPSSYFLLRRALRAGARPAAVVFDATPHLLGESPMLPHHRRQWPELLTPGELWELSRDLGSAEFFGSTAAAGLVPSLRARPEVRAAVAGALRGGFTSRRYLAAQFWRNARVNLGANAFPPIPQRGTAEETFANLYGGGFRVDPVNARYLDRFLDLAAAHGIPVFWTLPPFSADLQAVCERRGFDAAHTAFVRDCRRRHPGVTVLDARRSNYGQDLHTEYPVHLNRLGALAFSADLGAALARHLGHDFETPSGWVALPPYRPRPDLDVEDVNESALALERRDSARR